MNGAPKPQLRNAKPSAPPQPNYAAPPVNYAPAPPNQYGQPPPPPQQLPPASQAPPPQFQGTAGCTWLKCPYAQKDMAKAMGAKFDFNGCKKWYVQAGVDPTPFARWL